MVRVNEWDLFRPVVKTNMLVLFICYFILFTDQQFFWPLE